MKVLLVGAFGFVVVVLPLFGNVGVAESKVMKVSASISLDAAFSPLSPVLSRWTGGMPRVDNGNHYGWFNGNGNGYGRPQNSVPVPGTLLLFGGGFAGFAAWRRWINRRDEVHQPDRRGRSLANHSVLHRKPE